MKTFVLQTIPSRKSKSNPQNGGQYLQFSKRPVSRMYRELLQFKKKKRQLN